MRDPPAVKRNLFCSPCLRRAVQRRGGPISTAVINLGTCARPDGTGERDGMSAIGIGIGIGVAIAIGIGIAIGIADFPFASKRVHTRVTSARDRGGFAFTALHKGRSSRFCGFPKAQSSVRRREAPTAQKNDTDTEVHKKTRPSGRVFYFNPATSLEAGEHEGIGNRLDVGWRAHLDGDECRVDPELVQGRKIGDVDGCRGLA